LALVALAATWGSHPAVAVVVVIDIFLAGAVLAAVHHAEVIAAKVGEPYGSIVLAVAVTVIEVGLIVTLMISGGNQAETLARDTVFAAVMITCNGIVGVSILTAALRDRVATFNAEGSATAFATVITLTTLCLVLPNFTTSKTGPEFSSSQLVFAALASVSLYVLFLFVQSVRHRGLFMHVEGDAGGAGGGDEVEGPGGAVVADEVDDPHGDPPTRRETQASLALLLVALVTVVGLAKTSSHAIEEGVKSIGAPASAVGVVIALLVLMPETLTAWRNARRGRVQISFNLAYGSAMASIGLTIPAIAIASIWLSGPLVLGLGSTQIGLLFLSAVVGALTLLPGRSTLQEGGVHLIIFAAFVFLAFNP
jgi:Ca2+:H+ antiporter